MSFLQIRRILITVTAIAAVAVFSSCQKEPIVMEGPLFLSRQAVWQSANPPVSLFTLPDTVRDRSLSRYQNMVLSWSHKTMLFQERNSAGRLLFSKELEADFVYIHKNYVLARGIVYEDTRGFEYKLLRFNGKKLEQGPSIFLDCFPSDVLFLDDGRVFLTGVSLEGTVAAVYELNFNAKKTARVFSIKRTDSFPRLALLDTLLVLFFSARDADSGDLRLFGADISEPDTISFKPLSIQGLPRDCVGFAGYGFVFDDMLCLPAILVGAVKNLISIQRTEVDSNRAGAFLSYASSIEEYPSVFLPLGPAVDNQGYWYVDYDPLKQDAQRTLVQFSRNSQLHYPLN